MLGGLALTFLLTVNVNTAIAAMLMGESPTLETREMKAEAGWLLGGTGGVDSCDECVGVAIYRSNVEGIVAYGSRTLFELMWLDHAFAVLIPKRNSFRVVQTYAWCYMLISRVTAEA